MNYTNQITGVSLNNQKSQMLAWIATDDGGAKLNQLRISLETAPISLVDLGQYEFWRSYQDYLYRTFLRRKQVGELKILLQEVGFECRATSKGDWCGIRDKGATYWRIADSTNEVTVSDSEAVPENAWTRIGLDGTHASEVRAEIFSALVLRKYGPKGWDNVEACSEFHKESGMSFTDFFGGLNIKAIRQESWGEQYCTWETCNEKSHLRVVPKSNYIGANTSERVPRSAINELTTLASERVPEKIDFNMVAQKYGLQRTSVLWAYCLALKIALTGQSEQRINSGDTKNGQAIAARAWSAICRYFIGLCRALIGRAGPARTRYLRKWIGILRNDHNCEAEIVLEDGRVIVGRFVGCDEDYFEMMIGRYKDLIPISTIRTIKAVAVSKSINGMKTLGPAANKEEHGLGSIGIGRINRWDEDKGFGFIRSGQSNYFFTRKFVNVRKLSDSLKEGYRGQFVEFSVVSEAFGNKYAHVEIHKLLKEGTLLSQINKPSMSQDGKNIPQTAAQSLYLLSCPESEYVMHSLIDCDFHGLEETGVTNERDLPAKDDDGYSMRINELIEAHGKALEKFWTDMHVDDFSRKTYNSESFNREMLRYQKTGVKLLLAVGDNAKSITAWRIYLYRKLQELLFSADSHDLGSSIAYLVMIARSLTNGGNRYWNTVVPILFLAIYRNEDCAVVRKMIDDTEYRNAVLGKGIDLNRDCDYKMLKTILALGLDKKFDVMKDWSRDAPQEMHIEDYETFRDRIVNLMHEEFETLSVEGLENIKELFSTMSHPIVDTTDYRVALIGIIVTAIAYVKAEEYNEFKRIHDGIVLKIREFESNCLDKTLSLPSIDIYYRCVCEIRRRIEADFVGRMCIKINLELTHADSCKYYVDDGEVELNLRLSSPNHAAPPIRDLKIYVDGHPEAEKWVPGPIHGGSSTTFTIELELTDEEIRAEGGNLCVNINYDKCIDLDDDDGYIEESGRETVDLYYEVNEGEFEPIGNPYNQFVGKPAAGSLFVGRERLLDEIEQVFSSGSGGQGYVLYGQRRSGKTSVYNNISKRLGDDDFVYTKISAHALEECLGLEGFSRAIEDSVGNDLDNGKDYMPDEGIASDNYLGRIRHMARAISEGRGNDRPRSWVIGIDEFTSFYQYYHSADIKCRPQRKEAVRNFLRELKALLEESAFNLLIIGQESIVQMQNDFPNEFAILHLHRLSYLREEDVKKLADEPTMKTRKNGEQTSRFKGKALARLFYLTGGQPWFTQQFCKTLVDYLNENQLHDISESTIDSVEERLCLGDTKLADAQFEPFVNLMADIDEEEVVRVYYKIAEGNEEEYDWIPIADFSKEQKQILHLLESRGIIKVKNEEVQLRMGLFASWLRKNPGRTRISFGGKEDINEN